MAEGELVGLIVDGARMASPGLLATALRARRVADLAVVAYDTAAAHQHIRDRYSGCLAAPGNEEQFRANLSWLLSDREGLRGVRMHARHRACQLDWSAVQRRFEGYLQRHCATPVAVPMDVPGK